ncbi:hypothetical protein [Streptosporangium sp. NPDC001681]|uniref:hypothetical protein n=1 Tax=Streptosporangium sp. NPDC001681 TaxID=3154395 RepID=UPI003323CDA6
MRKRAVTVTVDTDLIDYAEQQVEGGDARSLSAYVNEALAARVRSERRARATWGGLVAKAQEDPAAVARAERMAANVRAKLG